MALTLSKRVRLIVAWGLGLYLADMFVRMGWIKFDPRGFWTAAFARWGYPAWLRIAVGAVEVVGGAMLVIPWLASLGGIAVALVMGGAWLTRHLDKRYVDVAWITFYALSCLWIAYEWWGSRFWRRRRP
jgi:uncharacterized membrane protein YphA (DoxX/SURF4 family)